ncbi:MAG: putative membrane protein [Rhodobacteraceae bacterium HLUCCA12]|nr:MAG: putative membrane protein [Rhodobacteraceae bacterium HLUCCA12]
MSMKTALGQTWRQALLFGLVFVAIGFGLDAMLGRSVDLAMRATTIIIASGIYWLATAWMLTRRQG